MKTKLLLSLPLALILAQPIDALARRSHSSHSSSTHSSADNSHAKDSHESSGANVSLTGGRRNHSERDNEAGDHPQGSALAPATTANHRQKDSERRVAATAAEAARKLEASLAEARQKAAAEQAAIAAAAEQKRRDAEQREQERRDAQKEQQQRQYAWESRCQIQPVMSDLEIETCREAWTKPVPKDWGISKQAAPDFPGF